MRRTFQGVIEQRPRSGFSGSGPFCQGLPKISLASAFSSGESVAPWRRAASRFSVMSSLSLVSLAMSPGFSPFRMRSTIRPVWRPIR